MLTGWVFVLTPRLDVPSLPIRAALRRARRDSTSHPRRARSASCSRPAKARPQNEVHVHTYTIDTGERRLYCRGGAPQHESQVHTCVHQRHQRAATVLSPRTCANMNSTYMHQPPACLACWPTWQPPCLLHCIAKKHDHLTTPPRSARAMRHKPATTTSSMAPERSVAHETCPHQESNLGCRGHNATS